MKERLRKLTRDLMLIPGLSGHEDRVRRALAKELTQLGLARRPTALAICLQRLRAIRSCRA